MDLAGFLHGTADSRTGGQTLTHGRGYDVFTSAFFAGRRDRVYRRLAELSGARPGEHALDVGSGTGYLTVRVAERLAPGGTIRGIDPSPDFRAQAARAAAGRPGCTFEDGVAERLPAADGSCDLVVSALMLHHLPEPDRAIAVAEMHRVLRPGGRLLLADFRPPTSALGRHLVGAAVGPVMENNPVHLMRPLVEQAGFGGVEEGDLRPWVHYVQAVR
ncbi:methyltransferase domain-containing protein [Kitasatospora sp. NPDC049285]|uniref:class I SAM-dependent methyltransferase n=1 Tax=Kitasatospora sp. NPDC049285 TaxID=3157096 RepID=UPI003442232A